MSIETYIHKTLPGTEPGTLAFVLHGTGGTEDQILPLARQLLPAATLIAPRGDTDEGGARRFFRRFAEGQYDMPDVARATAKMAAFVEAKAAEARASRVIGIGYSNGANILAATLFARRALFDDAVLFHPLIMWDPEPGPVRSRILLTAGANDPICPPALTRRLEDWLWAQGAPLFTHWHPGGHGIAHSEVTAATLFLAAGAVAETPHAR